ncbi:putative membrane protein [Besnoitia besnoiti]|uniref:Putative membrane protein n=1 Tax=Besnoitia besnoiti TaxID=94643 RepID=A0A2A9MGW0_BESBE|nr:putative membrane protein [Besnoitia besnoiti]PFH35196.1 putative membrane protein [Besnoitia besnoiti]
MSLASRLMAMSRPRLGMLQLWCKDSKCAKEKVTWSQFFDSEYFWTKANVGPFFLVLFTSPFWYQGLKTMYASCRYRKLNEREIISDRYTWLHERMLEDEVERALLQHVPAGGFDKSRPGLILGPSAL